MTMNIRHRIAGGALALALLGGTGSAITAQESNQGQGAGGIDGLVNAIVQAQLDDTVNVEVVDSLNNLTALNNILNNSPILSASPILSGNDVSLGDVSVLEGTDVDLDALGIAVEDVIGVVEVGEDFIVLV